MTILRTKYTYYFKVFLNEDQEKMIGTKMRPSKMTFDRSSKA